MAAAVTSTIGNPSFTQHYPTRTPQSIYKQYISQMHNRGVVVAVFIACVSCFSTARYDRAHTQRVSTINARYDTELARERQQHAALAVELEHRRALLIAVIPETSSHNESLVAEIDRQSTLLAQRHARAQSRIEQLRQRDLAASQQQRAREIETGRAERRARVRAAADAFAAEVSGQTAGPLGSVTRGARGQPSLAPAAAARSTAGRAPEGVRSGDCAPAATCAVRSPQAPAPASITCVPDAPETVGQTTAPSSHNHLEPSTPIGCVDDADCPGGMSCDASAAICCATIVR